jgi:hypothetical protein
MRTLTEKYRAILEGNFTKAQFLRDARLEQPQLITQHNSYTDAVKILKNKGLLFEVEALPTYRPPVTNPEDLYSIDTVERGIDVEVEKIGILPPMLPDEEVYNKAKATTLKNLLKNPNFYIDDLAGVKSTTKRIDTMKPAQRSNLVDKDNGMVKVQLKEAVKKLIYRALDTTPTLLKEQDMPFASSFDANTAFTLHKSITKTLRETGRTFEQEWPLASSFGFFVNKVMKGEANEGAEQHIHNPVLVAKQTLEDIIDPETLANPELMHQFLENLKNEFMTDTNLFDKEEDLAENNNKPVRRRITSEGNIK